MTKEELGKLSVADLKERAKELGIKGISAMRKMDLVNALSESTQSKRPNANLQDKTADAAAQEDRKKTGTKNAGDGRTAVVSEDRRSGANADPAAESAQTSGDTSERRGSERRPQARDNGQGSHRQTRRQMQPRQDGHARVIVRKSSGVGQGTGMSPQSRSTGAGQGTGMPPQNRSAGTGQGTGMPPQSRSTGSAGSLTLLSRTSQPRTVSAESSQQKVLRPSAPMTRGEMHQSNPQPRENVETIQDRMEQDRPPMELKQLDSGNEVSGVLEVMSDGYGFIRSNNYLPGEDDVYVSPSQIRKFGLKTGDIVCGNTRVHAQQEKFSALLFVKLINGYTPSEAAKRYDFDSMTPVFPDERLRMERSGREIAMRIVDLLAPIGKGQRGLIVSPPKAGKTTLLKDIARSILRNNPEMHIIIMLIDERPEEVTDIREAIVGDNVEVLDSTFDETPEHHKRVAEMGIERARRLVEHRRDVVILLDSITRLARAYNLIVPPSGRTLSGGLDPAALHPPKRFFGAARNMREGGSLTILATALVDTGSKMDDVVYEEFKGTGNMELILDRKLSERRVFPAIDIQKSGTRREDLLLTPDEGEAAYVMRRAMNGMKGEDAVERILDMFARTRSNEELIQRVKHSHVV